MVIRSRFKQNSENEKASLYHAAREAKNDRNNVNGLKVGGRVVKDKKIIEEEVIKYFGALFNVYHNTDLVDTGLSFIPDNRDKLHGEISLEELDEIVKNLDNNKSPGLDGLPYEFYKVVWSIIKEDFIRILQCQLDRF